MLNHLYYVYLEQRILPNFVLPKTKQKVQFCWSISWVGPCPGPIMWESLWESGGNQITLNTMIWTWEFGIFWYCTKKDDYFKGVMSLVRHKILPCLESKASSLLYMDPPNHLWKMSWKMAHSEIIIVIIIFLVFFASLISLIWAWNILKT